MGIYTNVINKADIIQLSDYLDVSVFAQSRERGHMSGLTCKTSKMSQ